MHSHALGQVYYIRGVCWNCSELLRQLYGGRSRNNLCPALAGAAIKSRRRAPNALARHRGAMHLSADNRMRALLINSSIEHVNFGRRDNYGGESARCMRALEWFWGAAGPFWVLSRRKWNLWLVIRPKWRKNFWRRDNMEIKPRV